MHIVLWPSIPDLHACTFWFACLKKLIQRVRVSCTGVGGWLSLVLLECVNIHTGGSSFHFVKNIFTWDYKTKSLVWIADGQRQFRSSLYQAGV